MNFFIWWKNVSFSRYRDFYVFVKFTNFKICDVTISIATYWRLHLCFFLLNPKYYRNEIWSIRVCCMINISNMFLAQCWRMETSSRPFYDFNKMTIWRDLSIFSNWLIFTIFNSPLFKLSKKIKKEKKNETLEVWHNWLLSNLSRLLN